jgi:magnesium transporter
LTHNSPAELALMLSNKLVRRYVDILLELEPRLDHLEDIMFESSNDGILAELTGYKSRLRHLARIANYHLHIATELRKYEITIFPKKLKHEIMDLYEQIERSRSLAALYYEVATDLTDGYLALASHRLNSVMKVLTIITVIFVPLTFLAGIYGMNFSNMPELGTHNGYFIVLGVMFVAAVVQLIFFRRRGWL